MSNLLFTPDPGQAAVARRAALERDLAVIWGQWRAIGARGRTAPRAVHVIDPEPLLLASLAMARYDRLLLDAMLAWLVRHGALMNLQRLRGLASGADPAVRVALAAVAGVLAAGGEPLRKWRALDNIAGDSPATPYYLTVAGRSRPGAAAVDAAALREHLHLRRQAVPLTAGVFGRRDAPSLLLRLRALCGMSMRCEILCVLGTGARLGPAAIARQAAQSPRAVQKALVEMARSGCVSQVRGHRRRDYELAVDSPLLPLLRPDGTPTPWLDMVAACRRLAVTWRATDEDPSV